MYLLDGMKAPSFATFGNIIRNELTDSIEQFFGDVNTYIFEKDHVDLEHTYIGGTKIEANANRYTWVWKKSCAKNRGKVFKKISTLTDAMNLEVLGYLNVKLEKREEYAIDYVSELLELYKLGTKLEESTFVSGCGHRKSVQQKQYVYKNKYGRTEEIYECESCEGCPHKSDCCPKATNKRTIRMNEELTSIHQEVISNLESIHGALLRMKRSIQAEGTFGVLKWDKSYKRLIRRGEKNVILELMLISCGFNLYKYHNKKQRKGLAA